MAEAVLKVHFAGPLVTVQDAGRPGNLRYGVPASGAMDALSYAAANAALGNAPGAACVEVSLGGIVLECDAAAVTLAIAGGDFAIDHAGAKLSGAVVLTLSPSEKLTIRAGVAGSWCYLAVAGDLQTQRWMGHAATHALSNFGGGAVRAGDVLHVTNAQVRDDREGAIPQFTNSSRKGVARVVMGPQDRHFTPQALESFTQEFTVSEAYDRMGMRLGGPRLPLADALSIPSEPIQRGSIQVSDIAATVLLADHQTTGGYPKIATVIGPDLDALVQLRHRDPVCFKPMTPEQAVAAARDYAARVQGYLDDISVPRGTLAQRLMRENLISGFTPEDTL